MLSKLSQLVCLSSCFKGLNLLKDWFDNALENKQRFGLIICEIKWLTLGSIDLITKFQSYPLLENSSKQF